MRLKKKWKIKINYLKYISLQIIVFIVLLSGLYPTVANPAQPTVATMATTPFKNTTETISQQSTNITMFMINDLHGHIVPRDGNGGAGHMMQNMIDNGYNKGEHLLLSGGDHNTGGAIATLTKGEALIDTMNAMGFTTAAIGNHEFDFGEHVMFDQQERANFSLLSANLVNKSSGKLPEFATPWVVQQTQGINIGWIGLTTTVINTFPTPWMIDYIIATDYEQAVRDYYDDVLAAGADIVGIISHIPANELRDIAKTITDLDIPLMFGGHEGGRSNEMEGATRIITTAHHSQEIAKVSIDLSANEIKSSVIFIDNSDDITPQPEVQAVVDAWDDKVNEEEVISYSSEDIQNQVPILVDSLLYHMNSTGRSVGFSGIAIGSGIRDRFEAGKITLEDIVNVIPWPDKLVYVELTGKFLRSGKMDLSGVVYAGITDTGDDQMIQHNNGTWSTIKDDKIYTGVIPEYPFFTQLEIQDSVEWQILADTYRQAIVNYFSSLDDLVDGLDNRYAERVVTTDETSYPILILSGTVMMIFTLIRRYKLKQNP